jgi:shikimate kinase
MSPEDSVIATGGSAVYSEAAIKHLKCTGIAVYLKLPYAEIKTRLSNITTRGVVMSGSQSLQDVYEERVPLYEKYADLTIDCDGKSVEDVVGEITDRLSFNG